MDIKEFFKDLHKGEIEIVNEYVVSWKLGNLVLDFSDNDYECICVVYRNVKHKTFHQITHIAVFLNNHEEKMCMEMKLDQKDVPPLEFLHY